MKTTSGTSPEDTDLFKDDGAVSLQRVNDGGSGQPQAASREAPTPAPRWPEVARRERYRGSVQPMRSADHRPRALGGLPSSTAHAAAHALDLGQSRRLAYGRGEGKALVAFLDTWRRLTDIWFGPTYAGSAARQSLRQRGLTHRVQYLAGESVDAIPVRRPGRIDCRRRRRPARHASVGQRRRMLAAGRGRWFILLPESPHLSSLVGLPLLQGQGLRVASCRSLSAGVRMLVCAPAHGFADMLADRIDRLTA